MTNSPDAIPEMIILNPLVIVEMGQFGVNLPADPITISDAMELAHTLGQFSRATADVAKTYDDPADVTKHERCETARRMAEGIGNFALDIIAQYPDEFRAYQELHANEWN
jgi:hypothetical protein